MVHTSVRRSFWSPNLGVVYRFVDFRVLLNRTLRDFKPFWAFACCASKFEYFVWQFNSFRVFVFTSVKRKGCLIATVVLLTATFLEFNHVISVFFNFSFHYRRGSKIGYCRLTWYQERQLRITAQRHLQLSGLRRTRSTTPACREKGWLFNTCNK